MVRRFRQFIRDSKAVSALEYAILVGVIAVAIGLALTQFGTDLTKGINKIGDRVEVIDSGAIKPN